jgi:hypothetical protein
LNIFYQLCTNRSLGCGSKDCFQTATAGVEFQFDHLEIGGFVQKTVTAAISGMYFNAAYFCGVGLGQDDGTVANGQDAGEGVIVQSVGPFVLRFVTDNFDSNSITATGAAAGKTAEVGFSIDYSLSTNCPDLTIIEPI